MNTQIEIKENGTTTLATAGKYCDRNIDVNVSVPSFETEIAEQQAIFDSIIDRTITEYVDTTATLVGPYSFYRCHELESVIFTKAEQVKGYALGDCPLLKRAEFSNLRSDVSSLYNHSLRDCPLLEKLVLRGREVAKLMGAGAFTNSGIEAGTGYIYVPDDLVDRYKTETNWAVFADQIKPLSELEE